MNCVSGVSGSAFAIVKHLKREYVLEDFTHLPFLCLEEQEPKKWENKTLVSNYMELITTLIENLGDYRSVLYISQFCRHNT